MLKSSERKLASTSVESTQRKKWRLKLGGGEWEFEIPERSDYPDGEYPIEFKYGGEDLLSTALYLAIVPLLIRPYPWVTASDGVIVHGVVGGDLQPVHAAKYGDQVFIDMTTTITKPSRLTISLGGIDGDFEAVIFPTVIVRRSIFLNILKPVRLLRLF